jgi:hypothetical protein
MSTVAPPEADGEAVAGRSYGSVVVERWRDSADDERLALPMNTFTWPSLWATSSR